MGCILLDGQYNIKDVNIRWLRSQIGYVSQTPILFQGTIKDNIEVGVENYLGNGMKLGDNGEKQQILLDDIIKAAKDAYAHEFIEKLHDGYDTLIGGNGAQLSGGQKQRICIARALVRNPKILLLDESTASLDNESEAIVQRALEDAARDRTTLTIAHRLETIRRCDQILVLSDGRIEARGTRDELIKDTKGIYSRLMGKGMNSVDTNRAEKSTTDESSGLENELIPDASKSKDNDEYQELIQNSLATEEFNIDAYDDKIKRIVSLQSSEAPYILLGLIGSIIVGATWPLAAACISELLSIDDDSLYSARLRRWTILLTLCGIGAFVGIIIQNTFLAVSGERLRKKVRRNLFESFLLQDLSFFDEKSNSVGSLLVLLNNQSEYITSLSSDLISFAILSFVSLFIGAFLAFFFCWRVALAASFFVPGMYLSGVSFFPNIFVISCLTRSHISFLYFALALITAALKLPNQ